MKPEAAFETKVIGLAILQGWHVHTERTSLTKSGKHATAVRGHTGYPDVTLTHPKWGAYWLELKAGHGVPSPEQVAWIRALPPLRAFVVRDGLFDLFVVPLLTNGVAGVANLAWTGSEWVGSLRAKAPDWLEDYETGGVSKWVRTTAAAAAKHDRSLG